MRLVVPVSVAQTKTDLIHEPACGVAFLTSRDRPGAGYVAPLPGGRGSSRTRQYYRVRVSGNRTVNEVPKANCAAGRSGDAAALAHRTYCRPWLPNRPIEKLNSWRWSYGPFTTGNARSNASGSGPSAGTDSRMPVPTDTR
ncbi:hypothetical protein GobsT_02510 [Gemmata obscuriglobus]|nr:hypothetical protein GobsT_02510 [Gemmata obscuriglobus]VTR98841.1 unnamed protein product [Gemmata obscuriglobus UQM 2246]